MSPYRPRSGHTHDQPYRPSFYDERPRSRSPRRKSSPYDPQRGRSPPSYRDRSRDRRHSSCSRSRRRTRSRSYDSREERPPSRGRPSKEIMMEDIALHVTEKDILYELQQHYNVGRLDDIRIIRDRQTRQSRGFGFLRFPTLEEAEHFMDTNYPTIYIYGESKNSNSANNARVHITYGRERKETDRGHDNDWICKVCNMNNFSTRARCFRCQTLKPDVGTTVKASNVGDNDASTDNVPSQFLLFRGLESSVSEELFAKGVAKLNKPSGYNAQPTQTNTKKAKVASTTGDSNLGARDGTLRRVLLVRDRRTNDSWRYGFAEYASIEDAQAALIRFNSFDRFTIASKQVLVSYIHAGVFVPVLEPSPATERFTFSPLGNSAIKLSYWDEDAYVTEFSVFMPNPDQLDHKSAPAAQTADKEGFKNLSDAEKAKKRKAQQDANAVGSAKKVTPSHLQFWSNRHAELHGLPHQKDSSATNSENGDDGNMSRSYADPERNCCYLCMRQFTSAAEVNKHERLSDLHRTNLKDELKVGRAERKLEKHGVVHPIQQEQPAQINNEYRDRARERRKIYGVVNKKGEQVGGTKKPSPEKESPPPAPSKGASLLSKMGYTPGSGLGASGEGVTAPISQDIYVAGVGLGAQGGRVGDAVAEAERNTKGDYGAFAEQTRERARERYNRM